MEELGSDYLILLIILTRPNASVHLYALINSGGSAISFMDVDFAVIHRFPFKQLEKPLILNIINGRSIVSGLLTHYVELPIRISHHTEQC